MSRSRLLWGVLAAAMAGTVVASVWLKHGSNLPAQNIAASPKNFAPEFNLTDSNGQPFASTALRGTVWIADFIFTSCAGQCPMMTEQMRLLQRRLPQSVQLVSISVDPERDTPAVLAQYASRQGAQPGRWHFVTGEKAAIQRLTLQGFHLGYAEGGPKEEPIVHSVRLILVDRQGEIRGRYDGTDPVSLDHLIQEAQELSR